MSTQHPTTNQHDTSTPPDRDPLSWAALIAAFAVTAYGEYQLGVAVGFGPIIAAGIPASLDIYALRALRAHRDVAAVVIAMITVNALSHLVTTGLLRVSVPLVVAVSAIAPLVLWRVHALRATPTPPRPMTTPNPTPEPDTEPVSEDTPPVTQDTAAVTAPEPPDTPAINPYPADTPHHVVYDLWVTLGAWPTERAVTKALDAAGLPSSGSQAKKIRKAVATEHPELPRSLKTAS